MIATLSVKVCKRFASASVCDCVTLPVYDLSVVINDVSRIVRIKCGANFEYVVSSLPVNHKQYLFAHKISTDRRRAISQMIVIDDI